MEKGEQDGKGVSERKGKGNRIQLTSRKSSEEVRRDYILTAVSLLVEVFWGMPAAPMAMVVAMVAVRGCEMPLLFSIW